MKQLDKLIMQAKAARKAKIISPVHIVVDGYCRDCKGKCKYIDNEELQIEDNVVVIIDDIPRDGEADGQEENQTQTG